MLNIIQEVLVISLVCLLGSDDYLSRDRAEKILVSKGWLIRAYLREGMKSEDPEIRHRCTHIYTNARGKLLNSFEPVPEIDSAWFVVNDFGDEGWYDVNYSQKFINRYNRLVPYLNIAGRDGYPYTSYYRATRLWLEAELDKDANIDNLDALIEEMRWRDSVFLKRFIGK